MNKTEFDGLLSVAKAKDGLVVGKPAPILMPCLDSETMLPYLGAAYVMRVQEDAPGSGAVLEHTAVVVLSVDDMTPNLRVWCRDKFLDSQGGLPRDEAEKRCDAILASMPSSAAKTLKAELMQRYASFGESAPCRFWTDWRRNGKLCDHTQAAILHLQQEVPNWYEELQALYESAMESPAAAAAKHASVELAECAFRVPVLFEGDRGAGKTHEAREFARTNGYPCIEVHGHEGVEATDLLGYLTPYGNGMVWKDGRLSQAVRAAKKKKVVLILDELLRVPVNELSILLSFLSPDQGVYRLPTGRILSVEDGVGTEETLECPVQNLCVVATTNVGAEYAVEALDPAIAERFVPMRKGTEKAKLTLILKAVAKSKSLPASTVTSLLSFFDKMTGACSRGLMHRAPTTRTLVRALELADGDADSVRRFVLAQALLWVGRTSDGAPIPEQMETLTEFVKTSFKST